MLRAVLLTILLSWPAHADETDLRNGIWLVSDLTPEFIERYLQLNHTVRLPADTEGLSPFAANRAETEAREALVASWAGYQLDDVEIIAERLPVFVAWDDYQLGSHRFVACIPTQIDIGEWSVIAQILQPMAPRRNPFGAIAQSCNEAAQQRGWHNLWYLGAVNLFVSDDEAAERVYEAFSRNELSIIYRCRLERAQHNGVVCRISEVQIFDESQGTLRLAYTMNAERYQWE